MGRREQKFWGWGEPGASPPLSEKVEGFLRSAFGVDGGVVSRPASLEDVVLPPCELSEAARDRLVAIVGEAHVRQDRATRILRATGKSYLDLLDQRSGRLDAAPDAVVAPGSAGEVQAVLDACSRARVAVVPFGGGTSVVGGVAPQRGGADAVVTLDLARLDHVVSLDERSRIARFEPGVRLPEADHVLGARGYTLGHHPQSYEWATVGGCVATRSSGQASTGFGRIDEHVVALRCATPAGELSTLAVPASAAGPSLRELLTGSEGTLGVLIELTLEVRPVAEVRRYEGWVLGSFAEGAEVLRELAQTGLAPDVARLSDETETQMGLALAGTGSLKARSGVSFLRARGAGEGCLLITGWEGGAQDVGRRRAWAARRLRAARGRYAGRATGEAWRAGRYYAPHLRDHLLDRGVLVETLETATTWSNLERLHGVVGDALRSALDTRSLVACHVSHLYGSGASLYFTVLAGQDTAEPAAQWSRAKEAASRAIVDCAGTITHHHAVGRDHAAHLPSEVGTLGIDLLRGLKDRCDPVGVMNPGKLLL